MKTFYKIKNRDEIKKIVSTEKEAQDYLDYLESVGKITKNYKIEKEEIYFPKNVKATIKNKKELDSLIKNAAAYNQVNIIVDEEICDENFNKSLYLLNKKCKLLINNNQYNYYNFRTKKNTKNDFDIVLNARSIFNKYGNLKYADLNNLFNQHINKEDKSKEDLYLESIYLDDNNNHQLIKINKNYEFSDKLIHKSTEYYKYSKSKEILVYLENFCKEDKEVLLQYLRNKVGLNLVIVDEKDKKFTRFLSASRMIDTEWGQKNIDLDTSKEYKYSKYINELKSNFIYLKTEGLLYKFFNIEYKTFDVDLINLYKFYKENQELVNQDLSSTEYERIKEIMNNEKLFSFDTTLIALYSKAKDEEEFKNVGYSDSYKDKQKLKAEKLAEEDLY